MSLLPDIDILLPPLLSLGACRPIPENVRPLTECLASLKRDLGKECRHRLQHLIRVCSVCINPHLPNGLSHSYQLDKSIFHLRSVWCPFPFLSYFFIEIPMKNNVDPDQTPCSAASDLGLHCLPMSQKWDARFIWVNSVFFFINVMSKTNQAPLKMTKWTGPISRDGRVLYTLMG